jgi:asparagine synthase (glutamine-hydrolysing)
MCSISGIIEINSDRVPDSLEQTVQCMNKALRHRGPDDEGVALFQKELSQSSLKVCLGNTRLSIIDTSSAGHQPMLDPETGNCLSYNGESYNFIELRREIGEEFGPWRSGTDTEVVLRAYRKWGIEAFRRLRGMFALALWDAKNSELILARDPFGIKPLYYTFDSGDQASAPTTAQHFQTRKLLFASELRALLATGQVARTLDQAGVSSYLTYGSVQSPRTIIHGVWSLLPGQCLRGSGVDGNLNLELSQFDSIESESSNGKQLTRSESISELRHELTRSLESHLVSDVPLGVFLSGGMDSSAIVALMSQLDSCQPKTFSVVFDEQEFSEGAHADLVARKFSTEHHEVRLSESTLLEMLPAALTSLDQPSIDAMNTYAISKAVKEAGLSVALSGLGGDELFAGYPSFRRAMKAQAWKYVPGLLRSSMSAAAKLNGNQFARQNKMWQLAASRGTPREVYSISRQLFSDNQISSISKLRPETELAQNKRRNGHDVINTMSSLELQGYMVNTLLRDTDCMSMAHSLEVRVPFVDKQVVQKVLSLPGEWKLNSGSKVPKPLLAEILGDLLPTDFLSRPKMGFTLPFEKWMLSKLRGEVSRVLADDKLLDASYLNMKGVTRLYNRFLTAPRTVGWSRPWSTYVLAKWCEINAVTR